MTEGFSKQSAMAPITEVLADLAATSRWQEDVYKQLHSHPEPTPGDRGSSTAVSTAMSDLFLGRTDNVAIRFAAAVALLFNVVMVIIAIIAITVTVPRDDGRAA